MSVAIESNRLEWQEPLKGHYPRKEQVFVHLNGAAKSSKIVNIHSVDLKPRARHQLTANEVGSFCQRAMEQGDYDQAETLAREAVSISEEQLGAVHPQSLRRLEMLTAVLFAQDKLAEAETCARAAVDGYKTLCGNSEGPGMESRELTAAKSNLRQILHARFELA